MIRSEGPDKDGELCPAEGEEEEREGDEGGKRRRMEANPAEQPDEESQVDGEEAREAFAPPIPDTPSLEQVRQHRLTHRPYRSWCPHCIRGKGRAAQHRKSPQKEEYQGIPKLASDYFFIGSKRPLQREEREKEEKLAEESGQTPIIVLKDTRSKALFGHACPCKGPNEMVVSRLVSDLNMLGYKRVLIRTDGEPSILALWEAVRLQWGGEIIKVEAATGDHNANGDSEQAVQKLEDDVRTWLDATNDALKSKIPVTHDLLPWLIEHVCSIDRRVSVGADGKTPLERLRGRRGRDCVAEFAESVHYMPLRGDISDQRRAKANFEPRFSDGIFLGLTDRSDELIVFGAEGVRKARTIKRKPEGERWNANEALKVKGTPLQPNPGSDDARIRTRLDPGLADHTIIGDPVLLRI